MESCLMLFLNDLGTVLLDLELLLNLLNASANSFMTYVHRPVLDFVIVFSQKVFLGILLLFFVSHIFCCLNHV